MLVTDWNFRSNEDSRAPAEEADEEEALLLPPPPPAAIFPVCTSAAASPAAAAATAAAGAGAAKQSLRVRESRRWGGRPRGGDGARARLFWSGGRATAGHAGVSYTLQGGAAGLSMLLKGVVFRPVSNHERITQKIGPAKPFKTSGPETNILHFRLRPFPTPKPTHTPVSQGGR